MPILTKPCEGRLSEEIGVEDTSGKWVPEKHWPTVVYPPRKVVVNRYQAKRYAE